MANKVFEYRLPRSFSEPELEKRGAFVIEWFPQLILGCVKCGMPWRPKLTARGRLPRNYWRCPCGCDLAHGEPSSQTVETSE
jgi:hypothetical protein